jgi:hypothetical protein
MSTGLVTERAGPERVRNWSLVVGVGALVACVVGAFFSPEQFFRSYLASYLFYQGLGLGCLAILMLFYLTGGAWGFLIRRLLEAGTRTLPLLALLFIPVGLGARYLFLWARPEAVAQDASLQRQQIYLNLPFWWGRAVLFFAIFLALAYFLNAWSRREDETGDRRYARWLENLSGPGLVAYGICMHFGAVDWVMSLQPAFHSSIFGPVVVSGQVLSALAMVLVALGWAARRPPLDGALSVEVLGDLGNLLLTFLIVWAYMVFFQFMLIWIANLPYEVIWYTGRSHGGWEWVAWALFLLHFAVPFFLLLQRVVKRNPVSLACVAGLVLFMQLVFSDYQVLPAFPGTTIAEHWMDFVMPLGLGGVWLAYFLWELRRRPLLPVHDLNQEHALSLRREDLERAEREAVLNHG